MTGLYESGVVSGCAHGLLLVSCCAWLARKFGASARTALATGAAGVLVAWLPMQPHLIGILRGALGELSVGMLVACLLLLLKVSGVIRPGRLPGLRTCTWLVIGTGVLLYGNYLGYIAPGSLALYESGFSAVWLPVALAGFGVVAALRGWLWPALWMVGSLAVWLLGVLPTANLWDCILDAPLWLAACIHVLRQLLAGLTGKRKLTNA